MAHELFEHEMAEIDDAVEKAYAADGIQISYDQTPQTPQALIDHDEDEDAPHVDVAELGDGPALDSHGLPHIKEVLALLRRDVRERHISWLPGKENKQTGRKSDPIPYIAWPTACDYMDHYAVWWDYEIVSVAETTNYYIVHCRVTVHHSNGECPRDGIGWEAKNATGFGGPLPNAESQSIRRALAKFGLARSLYQKGKQPPVPQEVRAALQPAPQQKPQAQRTQAPAPSKPPATEGDVHENTFKRQWGILLDAGWTNAQIKTQYELIVGKEKFSDLPENMKKEVNAMLANLIVNERRVKAAMAKK